MIILPSHLISKTHPALFKPTLSFLSMPTLSSDCFYVLLFMVSPLSQAPGLKMPVIPYFSIFPVLDNSHPFFSQCILPVLSFPLPYTLPKFRSWERPPCQHYSLATDCPFFPRCTRHSHLTMLSGSLRQILCLLENYKLLENRTYLYMSLHLLRDIIHCLHVIMHENELINIQISLCLWHYSCKKFKSRKGHSDNTSGAPALCSRIAGAGGSGVSTCDSTVRERETMWKSKYIYDMSYRAQKRINGIASGDVF